MRQSAEDGEASRLSVRVIGDGIFANHPLPAAGQITVGRAGRSAEQLLAHACHRVRADVAESTATAIVLEDDAMLRLSRLVDRIAQGTISVLILGETGVGKEVIAELVHQRSPRADQPLVAINCGALTESLLEGELFGYEKGAFTGAAHTKPGLLETADGGTVFLDEIGELSAALQAKLLRALERRQVMRIGALKPRDIDVRPIDVSLAADANGHAHVIYTDEVSEEVHYASNASGSWNIEVVASKGYFGSLTLDAAGRAHVSYVDSTLVDPVFNDDLIYATNASGSWMPTLIDAGDIWFQTAIALDPSGHPHIAYRDYSLATLRYAACK